MPHLPPVAPGRRGRLLPEALLVTALVFLVLGFIYVMPWNFRAFDPVKEVLEDFSYTDVYYSKISREASLDTSIVLVNIGTANRAALAEMVRAVGAAGPRAIGIDAYFAARADSGTARLAAALHGQRQRLVTGEYLVEPATSEAGEPVAPTRIIGSDTNLAPGRRGYVNFVGMDSLDSTVRHFRPFSTVAGQVHVGWAAQLLHLADSGAYAALRARRHPVEAIRYRGNLSRFLAYEGLAVVAGVVPPAALRHKVVCMGYLGEPLGSRTTLEDLHFTPLNRKQIGRSLPDMYGLVIQANILSMMLQRDYITPTPRWLEVLLAFGVCYCQMLFFMYLNVKHALWYHPLSAVVQFGSGAVLVYLAIALYVGANLDLGVAFAVLTVVVGLRVLSLYGALASWLHRKWGFRSYVVRS